MKGRIVVDAVTKRLLTRIEKPSVVILNHPDVDELAASQLTVKKPLAVINFSRTMSGRYPSPGGRILLEAGIPLFDVKKERRFFPLLRDGMSITFHDDRRMHVEELGITVPIHRITLKEAERRWDEGLRNFDQTFFSFAKNTLLHANKELEAFAGSFPRLTLTVPLQGRPVVVVVRRTRAREELHTLLPFLRKIMPVFIGVDGGSDILLQEGIEPDIIVGDMDSVSAEALYKSKERILHAYCDGAAPGQRRLEALGYSYHLLPFKGTSEDIALLLAYEQQVTAIYLVGSHANMVDFLEKGRRGMGSTMLTRMKVGHLLYDVRGFDQLLRLSKPEGEKR